jgi:hypothetical protein
MRSTRALLGMVGVAVATAAATLAAGFRSAMSGSMVITPS